MRYNFIVKGKKKDEWGVCFKVYVLIMVFVLYFGWNVYEAGRPVRLRKIVDGDTISLSNGKTVNLLGNEDSELGKEYLNIMLSDRNIWLEKVNKNVRVWVGCESMPIFLYRDVGEKPVGCKKGVLVNEQLTKIDW